MLDKQLLQVTIFWHLRLLVAIWQFDLLLRQILDNIYCYRMTLWTQTFFRFLSFLSFSLSASLCWTSTSPPPCPLLAPPPTRCDVMLMVSRCSSECPLSTPCCLDRCLDSLFRLFFKADLDICSDLRDKKCCPTNGDYYKTYIHKCSFSNLSLWLYPEEAHVHAAWKRDSGYTMHNHVSVRRNHFKARPYHARNVWWPE